MQRRPETRLSGVTSEPRSTGFYLAKVLPLPADESILLGISAFRVPTEPRTVIAFVVRK